MSGVIYEITATVRDDLQGAFEAFMTGTHIPDLIATGAFSEAILTRSALGRYRILYQAKSRDSLKSYLNDHAPRLRRHVIDAFPDGIELSREEWAILQRFHDTEELS